MTLLTAVELGGERSSQGETEDDGIRQHPALVEAHRELLRARAEKLKAETKVLSEMAACYEAESERYMAEADLKTLEAKVRKSEWEHPQMRKLLLEERISEVKRNIRRNRDDAAKYKHRTSRGAAPVARTQGPRTGPQRGGRVDQSSPHHQPTTADVKKS